jgi:peptide/nickel transport system substrate-binding protein
VILHIIGSADIVSLIKGGTVDYAADGLTGRQYDSIAAAGFPVLHSDIPDILRISMAMDKEPFTDKRVRQAMLYAIPYEKIIKTALAGRGSRATCLFNPDDITCNNSFARYTYDPDKAKELLKEAGKTSFAFDFWYSNALPYNNDIAILIADSLKSIGVTANLKPTPALQLATAYYARINGTDQSMSGMYLAEATFWLADPTTLTNTAYVSRSATTGASNWARYYDPVIDQLHFKFRNSTDVAARTAAYQKIQDMEADTAADYLPLIVMGRTIATSRRITNVTFSQEPYNRFIYIKPKS